MLEADRRAQAEPRLPREKEHEFLTYLILWYAEIEWQDAYTILTQPRLGRAGMSYRDRLQHFAVLSPTAFDCFEYLELVFRVRNGYSLGDLPGGQTASVENRCSTTLELYQVKGSDNVGSCGRG